MVMTERLNTPPASPLMSLSEIFPNIREEYGDKYGVGKVRDRVDLGDTMLMVATDRVSVFDVVLPTGIPGKGTELTQMSNAWTAFLNVPNDLITSDVNQFPEGLRDPRLDSRATLVRKGNMAKTELIVRGYISGSMWAEYKDSGKFRDQSLPGNLVESQKLEHPIFTPSTKAEVGHDENINFEEMIAILKDQFPNLNPNKLAAELRDASLDWYIRAAEYALARGIIIADTKFEAYIGEDGSIGLGDEKLTPDSSRFWPAASYEPGRPQDSFDKQYVRDYAAGLGWDKKYPGPALPQYVVDNTVRKYQEARTRLFG